MVWGSKKKKKSLFRKTVGSERSRVRCLKSILSDASSTRVGYFYQVCLSKREANLFNYPYFLPVVRMYVTKLQTSDTPETFKSSLQRTNAYTQASQGLSVFWFKLLKEHNNIGLLWPFFTVHFKIKFIQVRDKGSVRNISLNFTTSRPLWVECRTEDWRFICMCVCVRACMYVFTIRNMMEKAMIHLDIYVIAEF